MPGDRRGRGSFTLVEILVAMGILVIMLAMLLSLVSQTCRIWQQADGEKTERQAARILLQLIGRDLESAVFPLSAVTNGVRFQLNPDLPAGYRCRDAAFWQAAVNGAGTARGDIVDVGYFVTWVTDGAGNVHGTLCRLLIPSTNNDSLLGSPARDLGAVIAADAPGLATTTGPAAYKGLVAENVLGLWINLYVRNNHGSPILQSSGQAYDSWSSPGTRPAYADISIVLIDPGAARRITAANFAAITSHYQDSAATNASGFLSTLPASLQANVRAFETRVQIPTGQ